MTDTGIGETEMQETYWLLFGWRGRIIAMTPKQAKALRDRINVALLEIEPL